MDFFTGFNDLKGSIRTYLICFFLIMPFWYLDITLFSKTFYRTHPVYIPILAAFSITICWLWMFICALVIAKFTKNFYQSMETKDERFILYWAVILSIPILGFLTFVLDYYQLNFKEVLIIKFASAATILLFTIIVLVTRNKWTGVKQTSGPLTKRSPDKSEGNEEESNL